MDIKKIEEKLNLDDETLYSEIGNELTGVQALPLTPEELVERGKRWFVKQTELIQSSVCYNTNLKSFVLSKNEDAELVTEIAKLLSSLFLPVNPINVAVLIVKKGLKIFCKEKWETNG